MHPVVAIIGRANVGKSTLFNRLARRHQALVDNRPGVTRDRQYADVHWEERVFTLVDTGGFEFEGGPLITSVRQQAEKALAEADVVVFLVDGREEVQLADQEVAAELRRSGKPVLLAVNKIDGPRQEANLAEFHRLGFSPPYPISSAHGTGLGTFLEALAAALPEAGETQETTAPIRVAVLGRPNVGKSSFINRVLGEERLVTSDQPGTTRDAIDTPLSWDGRDYILVDTAGIRRRCRITEKLERGMVSQAIRALERADVSVLLLEAGEGVTEQDLKIAGEIFAASKGCVVGVNKMDLFAHRPREADYQLGRVQSALEFMGFAPIVPLSVKTGTNLGRIFQLLDEIHRQCSLRVGTGALNQLLGEITARHSPPRLGHRAVKFYYATQAEIHPPTFIVFTNAPRGIPDSYRRYLVNQFRERLEAPYAPIRVFFKGKEGRRPAARGGGRRSGTKQRE